MEVSHDGLVMQLRDYLLSSLESLPGERIFHIHVLVSSPRKCSNLFPYAVVRHRVFLQDILILLSEQLELDKPRVLVTAVEAAVYHIPSNSSAVFYVSKVDSTGQGSRPSPTPVIVRALLKFYADPVTRPLPVSYVWIHVFARSQGQYLFANSSEHSGKHVLTDVQLCAWWKRILTTVAREISTQKSFMHYILPGYDETEALQVLGELSLQLSSNMSTTFSPIIEWTYGHPYSRKEFHLPYLSPNQNSPYNLGHYVPWFDDDPKARFIDEIACTSQVDGVKSPPRKKRARNDIDGNFDKEKVFGELGVVTPDDFWERMSFRQECISGAVTAFFVVIFTADEAQSSTLKTPVSPSTNLAQRGLVSYQLNKRLVSTLLTGHDFSNTELAIDATRVLEGAIKGLCDGLPTITSSQSLSRNDHDGTARSVTPEIDRDQIITLPHTPPPSKRTRVDDASDISPNPFPEPVSTSETYGAHIYGSIHVHNPVIGQISDIGTTSVPTKEEVRPVVTVLAVRKKKKKD